MPATGTSGHTSSAPKTLHRLVDVFPTAQQAQIRTMLSQSHVGVATQSLLPKIGGGRAAAIEILVATPAVRNLIRENKTYQIPSAMQVGAKSGMVTMDAALMELVSKGLVAPEDVRGKISDSAESQQQRAAQGAAR